MYALRQKESKKKKKKRTLTRRVKKKRKEKSRAEKKRIKTSLVLCRGTEHSNAPVSTQRWSETTSSSAMHANKIPYRGLSGGKGATFIADDVDVVVVVSIAFCRSSIDETTTSGVRSSISSSWSRTMRSSESATRVVSFPRERRDPKQENRRSGACRKNDREEVRKRRSRSSSPARETEKRNVSDCFFFLSTFFFQIFSFSLSRESSKKKKSSPMPSEKIQKETPPSESDLAFMRLALAEVTRLAKKGEKRRRASFEFVFFAICFFRFFFSQPPLVSFLAEKKKKYFRPPPPSTARRSRSAACSSTGAAESSPGVATAPTRSAT